MAEENGWASLNKIRLSIKEYNEDIELGSDVDIGGDKNCFCRLGDFLTNNVACKLTKITVLNLTNCGISKLPSNFQIPSLKQLILSRNEFREIPSCLYSGLDSLELLDLSHNSIRAFDVEPACCRALKTLRLNSNDIRTFPGWILIGRCPNLGELIYSENFMSSLQTSRHFELKTIEMRHARLIDEDLAFFKRIKTLEILDISNNSNNYTKNQKPRYSENKFHDIDKLFDRPKWQNLRILTLSNLRLSVIPEGLLSIQSLVELHAANCCLSWIPGDIRYLVNLEVLDISSNTVCSLPEGLAFLEKLRVVKAASNEIASVPKFAAPLKVLDLYDNQLEELPDGADEAEFVDFEKNLFDTTQCQQYDQYEAKKGQWRRTFVNDRANGARMRPPSPLESSTHSNFSRFEDDSDYVIRESSLASEENWDEEEDRRVYERHAEVTTSDEEWQGKEEASRIVKKTKKTKADSDDEWMFCDAD